MRVHFDNLLQLAHAGRTLQKAFAAGSVPPEMRNLWNRMESKGVEGALFDRGEQRRTPMTASDFRESFLSTGKPRSRPHVSGGVG